MVGQNHPTIWKLITKIRYEIAADRVKLALPNLTATIFFECLFYIFKLAIIIF